ncbi:HofO family protein [Leclercia sp.]|uniref:HofO family protein n=1 Tax=Leclercia sp. TaxID=1898428 RepID=UPI002FDD9008
MQIHPDSWYAMTPRGRCLCWGVSSALLLACFIGLQWRMQDRQIAAQQARHARNAEAHARLWAAVRKLSLPEDAPPSPAAEPFSPLAFDTDELRMVRWQPGGRGGELVLEASWTQIPSLFASLARHDVAVGRFSIQPEQKRLQIVMQLERQDAG